MKKVIVFAIALLIINTGCKKDTDKEENGQSRKQVSLAQKYAKYDVAVYKSTDIKKSNWLATLSKGEVVDLLGTEKETKGKKEVTFAKVKLTDGKEGYLEARHIADKPIFFTEDTKVHVRNNLGSKVVVTLPKGTLAFIVGEKANWTQIYAGKLKGKWITKQWVSGGFSDDIQLLPDALIYDKAMSLMKKDEAKAMKKLENIKNSGNMYGELAAAKLGSAGPPDMPPEEAYPVTESTRFIKSSGGLRMRDKPDVKTGKKIDVIPDGSPVELIEETGEELTISGATGKWSKVNWNGKVGWVFGGFLSVPK